MPLDDEYGEGLKTHFADVANVGGWRSGLLVYNGTPLAIVAEDLKRTAGMQVSIAPDASGVKLVIDTLR